MVGSPMSSNIVVPRVAVIGCGHWGRNLVRNFAKLGALVAVSDVHIPTAEKYAAEFGVKALSFDETLDQPDIAGVVIAAPAEMHADMALRALAAGKHVYVEKPLALKAADGEAMVAAAKKADRVLMIGHLLQYHPAFHSVLELLHNGTIGKVRYIYSNRLNLGKIRREENVFWSFAPHDISMILALAGELPRKVHATGSHYLQQHVADVTTTTMQFANGVNAHIFVSWLHPFKEQKLVVVGENAMLVFDDRLPWNEKVTLYRHTMEWKEGMPVPTAAQGEMVPLKEDEPLTLECRHFLDSIVQGTAPRTDGEEGLRVLRVLEAAQQSMNNGMEISL
jgi:UDP-2-acetamido-3-amino-2,3-dideoxy-glucuronate N-acetyltransferase